jgi:hypothetical protein
VWAQPQVLVTVFDEETVGASAALATRHTTPVGLVVIAIAALAAGFVLAYNTLTPFYDAVNAAFVLHQELWSWLSGTLALHQLQHRA